MLCNLEQRGLKKIWKARSQQHPFKGRWYGVQSQPQALGTQTRVQTWALLLTGCVTLGKRWTSLGFHSSIYTRKEKRGLTCVKALAHRGCSLNVNFLSFLGLLAGLEEVSDRSHQPDLRETQLCGLRRLHSSSAAQRCLCLHRPSRFAGLSPPHPQNLQRIS